MYAPQRDENVEPAATTTVTPAEHADCIVIRDLTVAYQRRIVLKGVQADIRRGQVIGVIGPNGGGKSTLLKAILGIAPIVSGSVTVFGRPASDMRWDMAYVPQREVVDWDFPVAVRDVVMMGRYPRSGFLRRIKRHLCLGGPN